MSFEMSEKLDELSKRIKRGGRKKKNEKHVYFQNNVEYID
jgi:hypothetical protein